MYQVILTGVREGITRQDAVKNLASLFKTTPEQVEKLLIPSGHVLKKDITEEVAGKYRAAIEAAGGVCRLEQTLDVEISHPSPANENTVTPETKNTAFKIQKWMFVSLGVMFVLIAGAIIANKSVLNRQGASASAENQNKTPAEFLQHLVSSNATVIGKDPSSNSQRQITFRNGNMEFGFPGENPIIVAPILRERGIFNTGACVYIHAPVIKGRTYAKEANLCMTDKDFHNYGTAFKNGGRILG